jgi:hypothetical protein
MAKDDFFTKYKERRKDLAYDEEFCPCCEGIAKAEFVDVGVGMQQVSPFQCLDCGASEDIRVSYVDADGITRWTWGQPSSPEPEKVTGYYINPKGRIFEMTFDDDHDRFCVAHSTTNGQLLHSGWVRITNLEGFAIDVPTWMTNETRRALRDVVKPLIETWSFPYVMPVGENRGEDMTLPQLMTLVSKLPNEPQPPSFSL